MLMGSMLSAANHIFVLWESQKARKITINTQPNLCTCAVLERKSRRQLWKKEPRILKSDKCGEERTELMFSRFFFSILEARERISRRRGKHSQTGFVAHPTTKKREKMGCFTDGSETPPPKQAKCQSRLEISDYLTEYTWDSFSPAQEGAHAPSGSIARRKLVLEIWWYGE